MKNIKKIVIKLGSILCITLICFRVMAVTPDCVECECKLATGVILYKSDQIINGAIHASCFETIYYFYEYNPTNKVVGNPKLNGSARVVYPPVAGPVDCPGGQNEMMSEIMWRQQKKGNFCPCVVQNTPKRNRQAEWNAPSYVPLTEYEKDELDLHETTDFVYRCPGGGGGGGGGE